METILSIIYLFLTAFSLAYLITILLFTFGWFRLKTFHPKRNTPATKVTVIVPARNEAGNIENCLMDLIAQDFPGDKYEIIVVDDNSYDNTAEVVRNVADNSKIDIKLVSLKDTDKEGKKNGITSGVDQSRGELIVTTDADCRLNPSWLSTIVEYYETFSPKLISGPVAFHKEKNLFGWLQSLEFLSLIASGAGAISVKTPIMCNGANIAFEKEAFIGVNGYQYNAKLVSGDDVFLMLKIGKKFGNKSIAFIKNQNAAVYTEPQRKFRNLMHQRLRWVSKSRGYSNLAVINTSLIVFLFNYGILAGMILGIWFVELLHYSLFLLLIKFIIDFPILAGITSFVRRKRLLLMMIPLEVLYVVYVSFIGLLGNILPFTWKSRRYNLKQ